MKLTSQISQRNRTSVTQSQLYSIFVSVVNNIKLYHCALRDYYNENFGISMKEIQIAERCDGLIHTDSFTIRCVLLIPLHNTCFGVPCEEHIFLCLLCKIFFWCRLCKTYILVSLMQTYIFVPAVPNIYFAVSCAQHMFWCPLCKTYTGCPDENYQK